MLCRIVKRRQTFTMQLSQQRENLAMALKDAYVEDIARSAGPEVMAAASSNINAKLADELSTKADNKIASGHIFLDQGKEGKINDSDPSIYFHKGGNTHQFQREGLGNPLEGGPGQRELIDMQPGDLERLRNQFDRHQKQIDDQKYGTGNLAICRNILLVLA